jgi:hypothetical protein
MTASWRHSGLEGVIPFRVEGIGLDVAGIHLGIADLDALRVGARIKLAAHFRAVERYEIATMLPGFSMPAGAARDRSWLSVSVRLARRMLKPRLRGRANTPELERMRERPSPKVTSRMAAAARAAETGRLET